MLARSVDRVVSQTDPEINERIRRQAEMSLCYYSAHPEQIPQRLRELDEEWDVERALEAVSSALSLMGFTWGVFRKRWWLIGLAAQGFFMQHALQGWCPPLGIVRRLGFRTAHEIEEERYQLLGLTSAQPQGGANTRPTGPAKEPAFQPA
jgi:hypothetical protein